MKRKEAIEVVKKNYPHVNVSGSQFETALRTLIPELKESEDELHRKWILEYLYNGLRKSDEQFKDHFKAAIAWLEKQGEHAKFRNSIQVGDKVTRNKDGVLVNLSQLNRVAKKQGEQKPAEWSEEDENMLENTIGLIEVLDRETKGAFITKEYINFLKSLKDRYTWKPSDEQMQALSNAGNSFRPFEEGHKVLWSLYNDLKKLREK